MSADEKTLSHLDENGAARMVDVSEKAVTFRSATAVGWVLMKSDTLALIVSGEARKGDVLGTARLSGIMAAKRTHELIPLCHQLALSKVSVDIEPDTSKIAVRITATAGATGQTGVEMEALTAVGIACLTVYDMVKAVDRGIEITGIRLLEKSGGRSGPWRSEDAG